MRPNARTVWSIALALIIAVGTAGAGVGVANPATVDAEVRHTGLDGQETETNETTAAEESNETTTTEASNETTAAESNETATAEATNENETDSAYPPGVTAEGVENASALVTAHQEALAETGYRFTFYENTSFEGVVPEYLENETANLTDESFFFFNDTTTVTSENGTVAPGLAPGRLISTGYLQYDGYRQEFRTDTWANESVMLSRTEYANQLLLQRADLIREAGVDPFVIARSDVNATLTKADVVNLTLHSGEFEVAKTEQVDNRTLFTLEAVEYDGYDSLWISPENVTAYDATVVVDERGRVHRLSLTVEGTEYEHVYMHYEFELTHLGPVEVSPPAWADRLRN